MIVVEVAGVPAPQGSKDQFGGESNKRTRPWRADVKVAAIAAMAEREPSRGPIAIEISFRFAHPRSHYRTGQHAAELRADAPVVRAQAPDLDKLARAILDALTGVAYVDDRQVWSLVCRKWYGGRLGATIVIEEET